MQSLWLFISLQIVSESFPVSSSGHSALALCILYFFSVQDLEQATVFLASQSNMFLLHIPTIFIVALFFRATWWPLLKSIGRYRTIIVRLIGYALVADCVTAACYLLLKQFPVSIGLAAGFSISSVLLISLYWCPTGAARLTLPRMFFLGLVQGAALIPGISRFGSVYTACRWMGLSSKKSFGVSWMIQWPLMVAAALLAIVQELITHEIAVSITSWWLIGMITCVGYVALWVAYRAAQLRMFWLFGIYLIAPILLSLLLGC